jgi:hypothetical protein
MADYQKEAFYRQKREWETRIAQDSSTSMQGSWFVRTKPMSVCLLGGDVREIDSGIKFKFDLKGIIALDGIISWDVIEDICLE